MDVKGRIEHWRKAGEDVLEAAGAAVEAGRLSVGMLFAHLAAERMLMAHVTRQTKAEAPRFTNLTRLAKLSGLAFSPEQLVFLESFQQYEQRELDPYPSLTPLDPPAALNDLAAMKEILQWLQERFAE